LLIHKLNVNTYWTSSAVTDAESRTTLTRPRSNVDDIVDHVVDNELYTE